MIPQFPKFKKLALEDKAAIERYTVKFPPYSDYNFVSLWIWNTQEGLEISSLNENLVIKFQDYLTKNTFYSFLGLSAIDNTVSTLINYSKKENIEPVLKLIPHIVVQNLKSNNRFSIKKDRDNFDYILSISDLIEARGSKNKPERNLINRFRKSYEENTLVKNLNINSSTIKRKIINLFYRWEKIRNKNREETINELNALTKLLNHSSFFDTRATGLFINNRFVGFTIHEVIHDNHGIIHFEKADITYVGAFQYLKQQTARHLNESGSKYINYEQDLGLEGLRKSKSSHGVVKFLEKYTIRLKE